MGGFSALFSNLFSALARQPPLGPRRAQSWLKGLVRNTLRGSGGDLKILVREVMMPGLSVRHGALARLVVPLKVRACRVRPATPPLGRRLSGLGSGPR